MADRYVDNVLESAPVWLQGPNGAAWLRAFGSQKDWLANLAREAVKARFPGGVGPITIKSNLAVWSYDEQVGHVTVSHLFSTTPNAGVDPYGGNSAWKIVDSSAGGDFTHWTKRVTNGAVPAGQYTLARYVKAAGRDVSLFLGDTSAANYAQATFNLATGTIISTALGGSGWSARSATITGAGNGWYLCTLTATVATALVLETYTMLVAGGTTVYTGDNVSGVLLWGTDLQPGALPSLPILVTTLVTVAETFEALSSSDALALIGLERGLPRGVGEPESRYRERLLAAFTAWSWAGTPYGLLTQLVIAGIPNPRLECQSGKRYQLASMTGNVATDLLVSDMAAPVHLGGSPECWSDFQILIAKPWPYAWSGIAPTYPAQDGDATLETARAVIKAWKGAVNRCVGLKAVDGLLWGGGSTWGGGGIWGAGTSISYTPPSG